MSQEFRIKLVFQDEESIERLSRLASGYGLTKFVKAAVEAYMESEPGKSLYKALRGEKDKEAAGKKTKRAGKEKSEEVGFGSVEPAGGPENNLKSSNGRQEEGAPYGSIAIVPPPSPTGIVPTGQVLGQLLMKGVIKNDEG